MNKTFQKAREEALNWGGEETKKSLAIVNYAEKIFHLVKKIPLPSFGEHTTGTGYHPKMNDPYWIGVKDVLKYNTLAEWQAEVALGFAAALQSFSGLLSSNVSVPTQKTLNDWFDLSLLVDNGFDKILGYHSLEVAFLYNQDDSVFNAFKAQAANGQLSKFLLAQYAELMETGEFYNPVIVADMEAGGIIFNIVKHPFWKSVDEKIHEFRTNPDSVAKPLPPGSKIEGTLPVPDVKDDGNLTPTEGSKPAVDLSLGQIEQLVELYIGFFGRAAEHDGLEYHKQKLDARLKSGLTEDEAFLETAADFWFDAKKFPITGYTEEMSNVDFIAKVYSNVLGRPDALENDADGVNYWADEMTQDGISHGQMVLMIIKGAHAYNEANNDAIAQYVSALLDNRTDVSLYFSQEKISGSLYDNAAIQMGIDVINRIDQNKSSVNNVKNALDNNTLYDLPEIELVGTGTSPAAFEAFVM